MSEGKQQNVGVELVNFPDNIRIKCITCRIKWSPELDSKGRLPKNYWKCPNGCNTLVSDKEFKRNIKAMILSFYKIQN